MGVGKIFAEGK